MWSWTSRQSRARPCRRSEHRAGARAIYRGPRLYRGPPVGSRGSDGPPPRAAPHHAPAAEARLPRAAEDKGSRHPERTRVGGRLQVCGHRAGELDGGRRPVAHRSGPREPRPDSRATGRGGVAAGGRAGRPAGQGPPKRATGRPVAGWSPGPGARPGGRRPTARRAGPSGTRDREAGCGVVARPGGETRGPQADSPPGRALRNATGRGRPVGTPRGWEQDGGPQARGREAADRTPADGRPQAVRPQTQGRRPWAPGAGPPRNAPHCRAIGREGVTVRPVPRAGVRRSGPCGRGRKPRWAAQVRGWGRRPVAGRAVRVFRGWRRCAGPGRGV